MSISVDRAVIAKLVKSGERFEILVDPEKAIEARRGKFIPIEELLAAENVFEDAKKGFKASPAKLNKIFGTNELKAVAYKIIKEGEVQLTTEQRKRMQEERKRAVAALIARQSTNPQTGVPHPIERVLNAMEQAKTQIDVTKSAEEQVDAALKTIQPIIPIKFEKIVLAIKIPAAYAAKSVGAIRNFGPLQKEEWGTDSYICMIEIPAGIQQEIYDKLNSLTKGEAEVKIVKKV